MITEDPNILLQQPLRGAVLRRSDQPARSGLIGYEDQLAAAGWRPHRLAAVRDRAGFYAEIAARLGFPSYFGANLDALWDCLRDVTEPTALIIDWQPFAEADPDGADRILSVLNERTDTEPAFAVVLG